jgi:hypothetical protein
VVATGLSYYIEIKISLSGQTFLALNARKMLY